MSETYVRTARPAPRGARVGAYPTGDVLHLGTFLRHPDPDLYGEWVPLCGQPTQAVRLTGTWARGWDRHAHWPLCTRCQRDLVRLTADTAAQLGRMAAHLDGTDAERNAP